MCNMTIYYIAHSLNIASSLYIHAHNKYICMKIHRKRHRPKLYMMCNTTRTIISTCSYHSCEVALLMNAYACNLLNRKVSDSKLRYDDV